MPPSPSHGGVPGPIRIAVLDEYPVLVDGLAQGLSAEPGFTVAVRATSGADLRAKLGTHPCQVVVAEPWLRSGDGITALAEIVESGPEVTVVVFSRMWDEHHVTRLMDLGVHAYVPKSTPMSSLPSLVRSAMSGMETRPGVATMPIAPALTRREAEVLALAGEGLDNVTIGTRLFITERTVRFHLGNAYRKLGAANRTEASVIARRRGLLS